MVEILKRRWILLLTGSVLLLGIIWVLSDDLSGRWKIHVHETAYRNSPAFEAIATLRERDGQLNGVSQWGETTLSLYGFRENHAVVLYFGEESTGELFIQGRSYGNQVFDGMWYRDGEGLYVEGWKEGGLLAYPRLLVKRLLRPSLF